MERRRAPGGAVVGGSVPWRGGPGRRGKALAPLIAVQCTGLRPTDRRRASGTRAPGDGGWTAGQTGEPYGSAVL
jgi:hypothetical protein